MCWRGFAPVALLTCACGLQAEAFLAPTNPARLSSWQISHRDARESSIHTRRGGHSGRRSSRNETRARSYNPRLTFQDRLAPLAGGALTAGRGRRRSRHIPAVAANVDDDLDAWSVGGEEEVNDAESEKDGEEGEAAWGDDEDTWAAAGDGDGTEGPAASSTTSSGADDDGNADTDVWAAIDDWAAASDSDSAEGGDDDADGGEADAGTNEAASGPTSASSATDAGIDTWAAIDEWVAQDGGGEEGDDTNGDDGDGSETGGGDEAGEGGDKPSDYGDVAVPVWEPKAASPVSNLSAFTRSRRRGRPSKATNMAGPPGPRHPRNLIRQAVRPEEAADPAGGSGEGVDDYGGIGGYGPDGDYQGGGGAEVRRREEDDEVEQDEDFYYYGEENVDFDQKDKDAEPLLFFDPPEHENSLPRRQRMRAEDEYQRDGEAGPVYVDELGVEFEYVPVDEGIGVRRGQITIVYKDKDMPENAILAEHVKAKVHERFHGILECNSYVVDDENYDIEGERNHLFDIYMESAENLMLYSRQTSDRNIPLTDEYLDGILDEVEIQTSDNQLRFIHTTIWPTSGRITVLRKEMKKKAGGGDDDDDDQ